MNVDPNPPLIPPTKVHFCKTTIFQEIGSFFCSLRAHSVVIFPPSVPHFRGDQGGTEGGIEGGIEGGMRGKSGKIQGKARGKWGRSTPT